MGLVTTETLLSDMHPVYSVRADLSIWTNDGVSFLISSNPKYVGDIFQRNRLNLIWRKKKWYCIKRVTYIFSVVTICLVFWSRKPPLWYEIAFSCRHSIFHIYYLLFTKARQSSHKQKRLKVIGHQIPRTCNIGWKYLTCAIYEAFQRLICFTHTI